MFEKILIANRGEIAVRIARTLQTMGIRAAAVYSEPDRRAMHVMHADEAYSLKGKTPAESYLRGDRIIEIAKQHGVDAIHPGYGFLSENAAFAQGCRDAGITFIGPSANVIRAMGDKIIAKQTFEKAGVPVVPGWSGEIGSDFAPIRAEAAKIGYPVLVKAAAGGGGKGMRVVEKEADLVGALEAAQREAGAAFGDTRVFLEKFIARPRHVEIQIFGDSHGNYVHLFERECSIQRRHQKIIEESPSPVLTPALRERMGQAAVRAAEAIDYQNAGTVEFMVDDAGNFYFLEVNTRLQVEHPVTEMVVGHDLVRAQVLVAAGERLPFSQADLRQTGHAIECRIYAEDADRGFLPSTGTIMRYSRPVGPNIRVDEGVMRGSEVSVYYDPMLAKLVVWGRSRAEAIARSIWALDRYVALGVTTNIDFLKRVLVHPDFKTGRVDTQFLDRTEIPRDEGNGVPAEALLAAAYASKQLGGTPSRTGMAAAAVPNPWQGFRSWRAY